MAATTNTPKTQLAARSRLYFVFQAGNCHVEGTKSYKLSELYDEMTNTFLIFQEEAKLPNLCSTLKVPDHPTEEEWDLIKHANDQWSEAAVDNVSTFKLQREIHTNNTFTHPSSY
jgi:hypothetical protein